MLQRWPLYSLVLGVSLLCVLSLSGCDTVDSLGKLFRTDKDANAQNTQLVDRPIQTVSIVAGTFSIEADTTINLTTNVDVKDNGTIIYQQITGMAFFTLTNANNVSTVNLTSDSVIIERPTANLLTLINISLR
jgi:hypothetical protein